MQKGLSIFVIFALIAVMTAMALLSSFDKNSDKNKIESRLKAFEAACNNLDFYEMVDCCDSTTQTICKAGDALVSIVSKTDMVDWVTLIMGGIKLLSPPKNTTVYISINTLIYPSKISAKVYIDLYFGDEKYEVTLEMIKTDDDWYINIPSSIRNNIELKVKG